MNTDNPAEMSNSDLEKDAERLNAEAKASGNQEHVNKSTAAEGTLKEPSQDESSAVNMKTAYKDTDEQDLDDLVHQKAEEEKHIGSLPDPEGELDWEDDENAGGNVSS